MLVTRAQEGHRGQIECFTTLQLISDRSRARMLLEEPVWVWCCLMAKTVFQIFISHFLLPLCQSRGSRLSFLLFKYKNIFHSLPSSASNKIEYSYFIASFTAFRLEWKTVTLSAAGIKKCYSEWWKLRHHNIYFLELGKDYKQSWNLMSNVIDKKKHFVF